MRSQERSSGPIRIIEFKNIISASETSNCEVHVLNKTVRRNSINPTYSLHDIIELQVNISHKQVVKLELQDVKGILLGNASFELPQGGYLLKFSCEELIHGKFYKLKLTGEEKDIFESYFFLIDKIDED